MDRRRGLRLLAPVLVALVASIVLPAGVVCARYGSMPGFREWLRARPATDDVWRAHGPQGVEIARGTSWRSDDGPARDRRGLWRPHVTILHGEELLLDLELEIAIESREVGDWRERGVPSEAFEALSASIVSSNADPDVHGIALLTVTNLAHYDDGPPEPAMPQGPHLQLDVFALAGPGEVELVVQELTSASGAGSRGTLLDDGAFARDPSGIVPELFGRLLVLEDPPEEGLAYQARVNVFPNWTRKGNGAQSAARGPWEFATTSGLYSAQLSGQQSFRWPFEPPDDAGLSNSARRSRTYTWNGETW